MKLLAAAMVLGALSITASESDARFVRVKPGDNYGKIAVRFAHKIAQANGDEKLIPGNFVRIPFVPEARFKRVALAQRACNARLASTASERDVLMRIAKDQEGQLLRQDEAMEAALTRGTSLHSWCIWLGIAVAVLLGLCGWTGYCLYEARRYANEAHASVAPLHEEITGLKAQIADYRGTAQRFFKEAISGSPLFQGLNEVAAEAAFWRRIKDAHARWKAKQPPGTPSLKAN